ncbi:MAG: lytic transglycosylase domain-containing protein [Mariprofundales bacterium]
MAKPVPDVSSFPSVHATCISQASTHYGVNPALIRAIMAAENIHYDVDAVNTNSDGSEDLGLMQINTWWLSKLKKHSITRDILLTKPCVNIYVGTWILATNIRQWGYTWDAIGAYNAGMAQTPERQELRRRYAQRIAHFLPRK